MGRAFAGRTTGRCPDDACLQQGATRAAPAGFMCTEASGPEGRLGGELYAF